MCCCTVSSSVYNICELVNNDKTNEQVILNFHLFKNWVAQFKVGIFFMCWTIKNIGVDVNGVLWWFGKT